MGKKQNNKPTRRKTRREPRRNLKRLPREHWKFKHGHINPKNIKLSKNKQKLLDKVKTEKQTEKDEDEIKYMEKENNLFITKDYYDVKETDKDILNWDLEESKNNPNTEEIFSKMNTVNNKIINQKVIDAYKIVGEILKKYTSGKLPKAFNILSSTEDWEDLINITEPYNWTPQAMYEATIQFSSSEILVSNIFYEKYLVPAIRNDIKKNKKLNIHYYNCLKRALFKPSAFFKGIILPMSLTLSAKEASIIGSILRKCSIPNNHASAALVKLIQFCKKGKNEISVGALFFMKLLLMKKYAFPKEVKEKLVNFFLSYKDYKKENLPVMWHQTFLCFIQHYKLDLTEVEKAKLKELNNVIGHHLISSEISKELSYTHKQGSNQGDNKKNKDGKMQIE